MLMIFGAAVFLVVGGILVYVSYGSVANFPDYYNLACRGVGMKEFLYIGESQTCLDYGGAAHMAKFKCDGLYKKKICNATILKLGG